MTDARPEASSIGRIWIAAIWYAGELLDASQIRLTMHAAGVGEPWLRSF